MSKIVERALDFLEMFAREKRPLLLSEIARLMGIPISSCHDLIQVMHARGYLYELAPRSGYYPTLRLQILGKEIGDSDPVVMRAELILRSLRDSLDESVLLAKVNGLNASYLLVLESKHPLRFQAKVGDNVRSLYATSGGKAILANLDDRALDMLLKSIVLKPLTDHTIKSKAALRRDVELGRERGYFLNRGESLNGVTTISATFRWNDALFIVTVAGPSSRLDREMEQATSMLTSVCPLLEVQPETAAPVRARA
jgi:DNA-binding IclR family transcriptional regulator